MPSPTQPDAYQDRPVNTGRSLRAPLVDPIEWSPGERAQLLQFIRRRMGPTLRAYYEPEDLVQDVWLASEQDRRQRKRGRSREDQWRWLFGVAQHRILHLSRSLQPRTRPRQTTTLPPSHCVPLVSVETSTKEALPYETSPGETPGWLLEAANRGNPAHSLIDPPPIDPPPTGSPSAGDPPPHRESNQRGSQTDSGPCSHEETAEPDSLGEALGQVRLAIDELDDLQRLGVVLRGLHGMDWNMIEWISGRSAESMRKRYARTLKHLRNRFSD